MRRRSYAYFGEVLPSHSARVTYSHSARLTCDGARFSRCRYRVGEQLELAAHKRNSNTEEGSARNIGYHYDAGNAFYKLFVNQLVLEHHCQDHKHVTW